MLSKREPILFAAKSCFLEHGYAATSMDQVAEAAGTTKRTIYNQFKDKDALLRAVIAWSMTLFAARLETTVDGSLETTVDMFVQLTCWRDAIGLQRLLIAERTALPDLVANTAREMNGLLLQRAMSLVEPSARPKHRSLAALRLLREATSEARFDRLFCLRDPYPLPPGDNRLDAQDAHAVRAAIAFVKTQ